MVGQKNSKASHYKHYLVGKQLANMSWEMAIWTPNKVYPL